METPPQRERGGVRIWLFPSPPTRYGLQILSEFKRSTDDPEAKESADTALDRVDATGFEILLKFLGKISLLQERQSLKSEGRSGRNFHLFLFILRTGVEIK